MPKRLVRFQKSGQFHFITFSCCRRYALLGTVRTRDVFVLTWSKHWTVMILVYLAFYASLLLSYSRALPSTS
jgi:hypothetical protein